LSRHDTSHVIKCAADPLDAALAAREASILGLLLGSFSEMPPKIRVGVSRR
jgi:hypothetical protein